MNEFEEHFKNKESMTDAYNRQHNIDPNSPEQTEIDEILRGNAKNPGWIEGQRGDARQQDAIKIMTNRKPLQDIVTHPTEIEKGSLDETPVEHDKMKDYDHSLEVDRWKLIGGKGGGDGIEMGDMGSE